MASNSATRRFKAALARVFSRVMEIWFAKVVTAGESVSANPCPVTFKKPVISPLSINGA